MDDETREFIEQQISDAVADLKEDLREEFVTPQQVIEILEEEDVVFTSGLEDELSELLYSAKIEVTL